MGCAVFHAAAVNIQRALALGRTILGAGQEFNALGRAVTTPSATSVLARLLTLLLVIAYCAPLRANASEITGVQNVQIVARLTGPGSLNHTTDVSVGGTDLGLTVNLNSRTYFLFGDTFSGATPATGGLWRNNVMAYSSDTNPADGIEFDGWITDDQGRARQVIHSGRTSPITEIPTGAVSIGDRIYAWYMAVNWWGPPGQWTANYAGLAYWREGENEFTVVDDFAFPGNGNFGMVATSFRTDLSLPTDDHLYVWGTPAGRLGGVKLARVDPGHVADISAYQYFGGMVGSQPTWVDSEFDAPLIVPPTVGEMSVMYNQFLNSWTMMYFDHSHYAIEVRQSPNPWGPWSDPATVATGAQFPQLYGSYMNPLYVRDNGKTVYFTMSLYGPYDVYLAKVTFITVPEPSTLVILLMGTLAILSRQERQFHKHMRW